MKLRDVVMGTTPEDLNSVKRIKSSIGFPYSNMEESITVARVLHSAGGIPLSREQIAGKLGTNSENSTFAARLGGARMFGLISPTENKVQLTDLGHNILSSDESQSQKARRDAFLSVDLYKKVVDHFRGKQLPSKDGLENVLVSFGVSERQKDKARTAFEKSAVFAGFFNEKRDRLVEPIIIPAWSDLPLINGPDPFPEPRDSATSEAKNTVQATEAPDDPLREPLIHGLLKRMPPIGTDWPLKDRIKWLKTLIGNLDAVYTNQNHPDDQIDLKIVNLLESTVR